MINKVFNLREADEKGFAPTLTTYIIDETRIDVKRKRPAVIICPGGGYTNCCPREGEPVALMFNAAGYHAFVLNYSVAPHVFPRALEEVSDSIKLIRKNADEWNVNENQIVVCGFSAGGHLAASIGTLWNTEKAIKCENGGNKPNGLILCYPVTDPKWHFGSYKNLLGSDTPDEEMLEYLTLHKRVSKDTPKTFLWHTFSDGGVNCNSSLYFAQALRDNGIPFEMHIYPEGPHGLSTATPETCPEDYPHVATWGNLACEWLRLTFENNEN